LPPRRGAAGPNSRPPTSPRCPTKRQRHLKRGGPEPHPNGHSNEPGGPSIEPDIWLHLAWQQGGFQSSPHCYDAIQLPSNPKWGQTPPEYKRASGDHGPAQKPAPHPTKYSWGT